MLLKYKKGEGVSSHLGYLHIKVDGNVIPNGMNAKIIRDAIANYFLKTGKVNWLQKSY